MSATHVAGSSLVEPDQLKAFVTKAFVQLGMREPDATVTATALVRSDMRGTHSHGTFYLAMYAPLLRGGGIRTNAEPRIVRETAGTAVIDADGGMAQVATVNACEVAAKKARDVGTATVLIRNSNHFGAAGYYTLLLAEQGLISIVASNTPPLMPAPGASAPTVGNAPTSYGVPDPDGLGPIIFDIALSVVAGTKILQTIARGEPIPEGWIIGPDGRPSTDPDDRRRGGLAPIGGHKGYGLALMVELFAGVLSGAGITHQVMRFPDHPDTPTQTGHWLSVFDIEAFMPADEFRERMAHLRREVHATRKAVGSDRVMLPGELEHEHELHAREHGLELEPVIWDGLVGVAEQLGCLDDLLASRLEVDTTEREKAVG